MQSFLNLDYKAKNTYPIQPFSRSHIVHHALQGIRNTYMFVYVVLGYHEKLLLILKLKGTIDLACCERYGIKDKQSVAEGQLLKKFPWLAMNLLVYKNNCSTA